MFELQLQSKKTEFHIENNDHYNTVADKTVQHHKMTRRKNEWLDPEKNGTDCHENRFKMLPNNGLTVYDSKNPRIKQVMMDQNYGREARIFDLMRNEALQVVPPKTENEYEYNFDKTKMPLAKLTKFHTGDRFDNHGIFGDLYDQKKSNRFG